MDNIKIDRVIAPNGREWNVARLPGRIPDGHNWIGGRADGTGLTNHTKTLTMMLRVIEHHERAY